MSEKRLPQLSPRMKLVADMVTRGRRVADIGCDHGYVSVYLYNADIAKGCIASDVGEGPLEAAKKNIELFCAYDGVSTRLSDGIQNIAKGEADCLLISGMGGGLIINILSSDIEKTRAYEELILEPQSDAYEIRKFLY